MLTEKCGLFGVYGSPDAARLVYYGLWALQHRGQENSGIASTSGVKIYSHKAQGLVAHVYSEADIRKLRGRMAIGHNRYSTFGGAKVDHSQPVVSKTGLVALAHNGNLPMVAKLRRFLSQNGRAAAGLNDSEMMQRAIECRLAQGDSLPQAVRHCFELFTGAFCLLVMTKSELVAVRDRYGIRPLSIGALDKAFVFSSETCALDAVGAQFRRDVHPGEMVVATKAGLQSYQLAPPQPRFDVFEFIYFARHDSVFSGRSVYDVRRCLGQQLAAEHPVKADVIVPVPDSAIPSAIGYSQATGIPMEQALVKNRYIHRTFIQPSSTQRRSSVKMKLNVIAECVRGKRVAIIDDSIVRGTTSKRLVELVNSFGPKEVHFLVASPPVRFPDFYGIDTPNQKELIAANLSLKKLQKFIGAKSLHYLSYEGLIKAIGLDEDQLCTACLSGDYPIEIGRRNRRLIRR